MGNMKKIGIAIVAILVIMQFFQIDKTNPAVDASKDFIMMANPPQEVKLILKQACYDCHSHETAYPWYTYVAPVSWWLKSHINEGREHLNFSDWSTYSAKKQDHKLEEVGEEVHEGEMPLDSYTWAHSEARLSEEQVQTLVNWVSQYRKKTFGSATSEE